MSRVARAAALLLPAIWPVISGPHAREAAAQADIPNARPVDPALLDGRRLVDLERGFSVEAPGDGWEWLTVPSTKPTIVYYYCRHRESGAHFEVRVTSDTRLEWHPRFADEFVEDLRKLYQERGYSAHFVHERAEMPVAGRSFHLWGEVGGAGGAAIDIHGYVGKTDKGVVGPDRLYGLIYKEPAPASRQDDFERAVRTFRLEKPVSTRRVTAYVMLGAAALAGVVAGVVFLVKRSKSKP